MKTLLDILPIAGLIVATISTIWGVTRELYIKDDSGKRHLTNAGRYSIVFTLLGLFISLNTAVLRNLVDDQQKAQAKAESERKERDEAFTRIVERQRSEAIARQTQEAINRKADEDKLRMLSLAQQQILGFSRAENLARKQMLAEVERAAVAAEQARKIMRDLDRSLHPLFPLEVEAIFEADLLDPRYSSYRERLIVAASTKDDAPPFYLDAESPLFPNNLDERDARVLLQSHPRMQILFIHTPTAKQFSTGDIKNPDLSFRLGNTSPSFLGRRDFIKDLSFSRAGNINISYGSEVVKEPDYSNGVMVSELDLLGTQMTVVIYNFNLSSLKIDLPGNRTLHLRANMFRRTVINNGLHTYTYMFPSDKETFLRLFSK